MKTLTVFTTTYNRAYLLPRLYSSLCNQTNNDFEWLVVDDGSTDDTGILVDEWIKEAIISIRYIYKENGGMHTGHNVAYENIQTELNICIDSDDYMPDDAVELINSLWQKSGNPNLAGIVGLDATKNGEIIGTELPTDTIDGFIEIYQKYGCSGDKKVVLRTDVVKHYEPYPEYENEKLVPLGSLYNLIGIDYKFIYSNDIYCIVEYLADGSSSGIFKQYKQSPRGFAYARKLNNKISNSFISHLKNSIHIGSSAIFSRDLSLLKESGRTHWNVILFPFALLFNAYIRWKIK